MAMTTPAPGWQTDDLGEEWVESSPSPPPSASGASGSIHAKPNGTGTLSRNMGSIQAKRGSLRGLGHAPARGLPPSRSASDKMMAKRDISGLLSPPESESEHEQPAGTCLVREGVEDDRGKHLVRNQSKGKDIFGALPLERMFLPPSPPAPPAPAPATATAPAPAPAPSISPASSQGASPPATVFGGAMDNTPVPRRISHQYAPLQPSRLSKSITPSNVSSSFSTSAPPSEANTRVIASAQDDSVLDDDTAPQVEQDQTTEVYYNYGRSTTPDTSPARDEIASEHPPQSEFSFVYEPPSQVQAAGSPPAFDPNEISHSTVHGGRVPQQQPAALRLFRSTYDTYTREHLSALVDSIAIEQSPSRSAGEASTSSRDRESTPARSDGTASSDARSSKRLRLSPPSPPKRTPMRDWGAQGRLMMDKIRDIAPGSATSASRSRTSEEEHRDMEPTVEYQHSPSPTPELSGPSKNDRPTHRSNPSTTSSGYLRAAEDLMARIKNRGVSDSGSNPDSPASRARQILSETDDNAFASSEADSDRITNKSKSKPRPAPSPRRMLRRLSASDEIKRDAETTSDDSGGEDDHGAPFASSSPAPRAGYNADDLNRYVSSSTHPTNTNTGTTISTSFVKHKGRPPAPPPANIRMIRPDDVMGIVPDRVGKMRYDQATMRWVREHGLGTVDENGESRRESEESEDVFAGMESWRDEVRSLRQDMEAESASDTDDDGDQAAAAAVANKTHRWSQSSDESDHDMTAQLADPEPAPAPRLFPNPPSISPPARPMPQHANSAPPIMTPGRPTSSSPPKLRSALRQPQSSTPLAKGIKKRAGWHSDLTPAPARLAELTPGSSGVRRSVSFSDGKKNGKIISPEILQAGPSRTRHQSQDASLVASARTKRIQGVLNDMEDLSLEDAMTPSKPPKQDMSSRTLQSTTEQDDEQNETTVMPDLDPSARYRANQTMLTECSFGVTHDKLVQLITDVQPFEPYWETLKSIDLRNRAVDNLARLKEFLPALQEVLLDGNRLSYLSGLPSSLLNLHVANNKLSSLTSVGHLRRIEILDISNNQLDSVYQLECLTNLKELKADGNVITDLSGIASIEGLVKLSVANNKITSLDCGRTKWAALETLIASGNDITHVQDLEHLESLRTLDLDNNSISRLSAAAPMTTMRTLRISDNDISSLDMSHFPKLRTLYADGNRISRLARTDVEDSRLENLSLRNQRCSSLRLARSELLPVKRLYLSGNALPTDFFPGSLPNLLYLEAAACSFTSLPASFASSLPALRILNLNYNFLTSLDGLHGMRNLRKLTAVGCRLGGKEKGLVKSLKGLTGLEELDLRMNPSTLSFYLPLFASQHTAAAAVTDDTLPRDKSYIQPTTRLQNSVNKRIAAATQLSSTPHADWPELDAQFRRQLPDEWYGRRLLYRGLIMRACPEVHKLDGLDIGSGERRKAEELMDRAGL